MENRRQIKSSTPAGQLVSPVVKKPQIQVNPGKALAILMVIVVFLNVNALVWGAFLLGSHKSTSLEHSIIVTVVCLYVGAMLIWGIAKTNIWMRIGAITLVVASLAAIVWAFGPWSTLSIPVAFSILWISICSWFELGIGSRPVSGSDDDEKSASRKNKYAIMLIGLAALIVAIGLTWLIAVIVTNWQHIATFLASNWLSLILIIALIASWAIGIIAYRRLSDKIESSSYSGHFPSYQLNGDDVRTIIKEFLDDNKKMQGTKFFQDLKAYVKSRTE